MLPLFLLRSMPRHLKKLSEETIHDNPWWSYKHDTYEKPDGTQGDYYYGQTHGVSMVIPVRADGRIVLTLQHRYLVQRQSIELPAGGVEAGTEPIDAARRELREETGWEAGEMMKIGEFEPANGFVKDRVYVFIAAVTEQHEQQTDDTEEIEVLYRRPDEIDDMIIRNDIWDGQTMATWAMVRHMFFVEQPETDLPGLKGFLDRILGSE